MTTKLDVEATKNGNVAIPAKLLLDILKTFPDHPLTFKIDEKTFGIEISSDYGKYKLSGQNGDEFPKTPALEAPSTVNFFDGVAIPIPRFPVEPVNIIC